MIEKNSLRKFTSSSICIIFNFKLWNTPLSQLIKIVKRLHFQQTGENNLVGKKIRGFFYTKPQNTCNFIIQNISSFWKSLSLWWNTLKFKWLNLKNATKAEYVFYQIIPIWIKMSLFVIVVLIRKFCETKPQGPFYWYGLTLNPAWISNHVPNKVWGELLIRSQNSTVSPLQFGNG